MNSHLD